MCLSRLSLIPVSLRPERHVAFVTEREAAPRTRPFSRPLESNGLSSGLLYGKLPQLSISEPVETRPLLVEAAPRMTKRQVVNELFLRTEMRE